MKGAAQYARAEHFSDGATRNSDFYSHWARFDLDLTDWQRLLLFDPQTSGGLLLAVAATSVSELFLELEKRDQLGYVVGEAVSGTAGEVIVY